MSKTSEDGQTVIVLTGRAGSKSISGKNMYPVLGRPLAFYPMHAARQAKLVDAVYVTTDCPKISALACELGVSVIERPPAMAEDNSEVVDALIHAMDQIGGRIRYLITVHCNSPVHRRGLVDECIAQMNATAEADSCVTGYIDYSAHPFRTKKIAEGGFLETWLPVPAGTPINR